MSGEVEVALDLRVEEEDEDGLLERTGEGREGPGSDWCGFVR